MRTAPSLFGLPCGGQGVGTVIAKLPETTAKKGHGIHCVMPGVEMPNERILARLSLEDRELLAHILTNPCEYMDAPSFHRPSAERRLFGRPARLVGADSTYFAETPSVLADLAAAKTGVATLNTTQEQLLFLRFNYSRYRVYKLVVPRRGKPLTWLDVRTILAWGHRALMARSEIVQANVPLVLAMAKRTRLGGVDFGELISEGNMALLRSVDKFDCSRGFKFSTYACRAILKSFSRVAMRTSRYRGRFPTEFDPTLEKSDFIEARRDDIEQDCVDELRDILTNNLADLSDIEQTVIRERFALDAAPATEPVAPKTLEQVGALIGVTKERVRQIQNKALEKIRHALEEGILAA